MLINYNKAWKELREILRNRLPKYKKPLAQELRFCSFFKHTLLPRRLIYKFDVVINNSKKQYLTGQTSSFFSPQNINVIKILMRGYLLFYFAILYAYRNLDEQRPFNSLVDTVYDLSIFNYFNNLYFNEFYINNIYLQNIVNGYVLDLDFYNTFINYYNFYLFLHLGIFEVILHFEDYKYEEDMILYSDESKIKNYKNKKKVKMHTDFYDYIKRRNRVRTVNKYTWDKPFFNLYWNKIDKEEDNFVVINNRKYKKDLKDYLMWQDNLFFSLVIYEFVLNMHKKKLLFNYFNYDFFGKVLIFIKKKKKKKNHKYFYFLPTTYYMYSHELLSIKRTKNSFIKKVLFTDYKNLKENFNQKNHILDIKYFGIRMPFLFFLLYMWYATNYRRKRYDLYIRGDLYFQEYFSKIKYFVLPAGASRISGKYIFSTYHNNKLFFLYNLKSYYHMAQYNEWFFFYSSYHVPLSQYFIDINKNHKTSFSLLLNNDYISKLLELPKQSNEYYLNFFFDFTLSIHYKYELFHAYELFMDTAITRFDNIFKLGRFGYFKYNEMIEKTFLLPLDRKRLVRYLEYMIIEEHYFNLYFNLNYFNSYFLNDFFNINIITEYLKYFKTLNFYEKIFDVMLLLIEPFFFKYYWKRCFSRRWYKLRMVQDYVLTTMMMQSFEVDGEDIEFNLPKYDFLMHFLNWRIESSNFFIINNAYSDNIAQNNIMLNLVYKNRFIELITQLNFLLNKAGVTKKFKFYYHYYLMILKNYYFDLLFNNIEYSLILFLNNSQKYINFLNNKQTFLRKFIYSNFIYRYYIYNILLESHFYDDWFVDWKKRIFWIYKKFSDHEGPRFYKKKNTVL